MAAMTLVLIVALILIGSIGLIVVGARILYKRKTKKTLTLTKYGFQISNKARLIAGVTFLIVGCILLFWVIWTGAEYFALTSAS